MAESFDMRVAIVTVAMVAALASTTTSSGQTSGPRRIDVTAERFSFSPSEIIVRAGEEIEFRVRSEDTAHGFRIEGSTVNGVVPKRGKGVLTVTTKFERPGRYSIECTRLCGAGHDFMRGVVIVRDATEAKR
jgi:cytochrome c oxidase subunit 2